MHSSRNRIFLCVWESEMEEWNTKKIKRNEMKNLHNSNKPSTFAPVLETRRDGRVVDCGGLENRWTERFRGFESLSLRNKRWKSADCKTNTQFYTQECKVGVFVLFKIIQPLHNKRVAILKESDEKRLIFIYPFSLIFQYFTSSWKYLLLYSNVRSGL